MSLNAVQQAVFAHVAAAGLAQPVLTPNTNYATPTGEHFRVAVLPANTSTQGLSSGPVREPYIVQVDVMTKAGVGPTIAAQMVQAVLALFPRLLRLEHGGEVIRFDVAGSVAPAVPGGAWYQVPVSIPCYILR
jgi:hypothetical protein